MKKIEVIWTVIGIIMSIALGPLWVPVLMVGLVLIWLYYKPKVERFLAFWQKWQGLYYLAGLLCLFRFWPFVPIFIFAGLLIDYMVKAAYK